MNPELFFRPPRWVSHGGTALAVAIAVYLAVDVYRTRTDPSHRPVQATSEDELLELQDEAMEARDRARLAEIAARRKQPASRARRRVEPVLDKARSDDASHCAALSISQTSGTTSILQQRGQVVLSQFSSSSGTLQQRRARRSNQHSLERSNDSAARLSTCGDCRDGQFGDDLRKDTTDSEHRSDVRTDWDSPAPLASLVIPAQRVGDEPGTAASAITASCLDDGDDTLLDVFRLLDRDHDGYLTIADLRALCNVVLEIELTPVLWDEWLLGVPHSKQGKISMGEFKQFTADLLVEQETSKHSVLQGAVAIWSKQADPELAALPTARLCTLMRAILGAEFDVAEASAVLTRAAKGGPLSAATLAALSSDLPLGV